MELKIVLKVQMNWNCQKCRTEALKAVADADGVNSVALEGENKEKVVVIGDGVDPVKLTTRLRKKVGQADVISVGPVKQQK